MTDWIKTLEETMGQLRGEGGCPWDQEQTHASLKPYLIEEAYELIDAIDAEDDAQMLQELGDVLLQVVFHAQIAKEANRFDLQAIAKKLCEMLIRRHPHVFGDKEVADAGGVVKQWQEIKKTEKQLPSIFDRIPRHLPALMRAEAVQKEASKVGFDWPDYKGPLAKIHEELAEVEEAIASGDQSHLFEEIGDLLFSVVNLSRFFKGNPEDLCRAASKKFEQRFHRVEKLADGELSSLSVEDLLRLWNKVKA